MASNIGINSSSHDNHSDVMTLMMHDRFINSDVLNYSRWLSKAWDTTSEINTDGMELVKRVYMSHDKQIYTIYTAETGQVHVRTTAYKDSRVIYAQVVASSQDLLDRYTSQIKDSIVKPVTNDNKVSIGFWHMTGNGPQRSWRDIDAQRWPDIQSNYSSGVHDALEHLGSVTPEELDGRILLLYGPAGTGKTTLLRSLADSWRTWCDFEYIIDPEIFLKDGGYITDVMLREGDDRWRLLLLEDAGELLTGDAKAKTGQSLSRLLNLTDGMLGEGQKILIAITTNEDIRSLHPAVTRPGRCMLSAEVGKLSSAEGSTWLGEYVGEDKTLAELYHMKKGLGEKALTVKAEANNANTGQYL